MPEPRTDDAPLTRSNRRAVTILESAEPLPPTISTTRDDIAYVLPMAVFLLFTVAGNQWPRFYVASYVLKTLIVAVLLFVLKPHYTKISWRFWWLGLLVGAAVVVQWVGMENWIVAHWPNYPRMTKGEVFNPFDHFQSRAAAWSFITIRLAGAALLVPVMEELFWRDFLWRNIASPGDFKRVAIGVWNLRAYLIVAMIFGAGVHIEWMTAIVCGLIYGALLALTRSLGACIVAHGVTNLLLGLYVLRTGAWHFW